MYTIGIDLGGTNIAVGLCDGELQIKDKLSVPTLKERAPEKIVRDMASLAGRIIERNGLTKEDIKYVGIATPGSVDKEAGRVIYANNLPFKNYPLKETFNSFLPVNRIILANDADAAALGESLVGAARAAKSAIMITLGTGIGGAIIIDGKVWNGGIHRAGTEIGHHVIAMGGRPCTCGRRGCFETYASATALIEMTREKLNEIEASGAKSILANIAKKEGKVSARTAFDAMRAGCEHGTSLVENYITYLAEGITNIINTFAPEMIIIGGGISKEGEYLTQPLREKVEKSCYFRCGDAIPQIVIAALGNDAGIIGAAALGS